MELDNLQFEMEDALLQHEVEDARDGLLATTATSITARHTVMADKSGEGADTWEELGACRGFKGSTMSRIFYSQFHEGKTQRSERVAKAKEICGKCTVREECLTAAHARGEEFGVWGGEDFEQPAREAAKAKVERSKQRKLLKAAQD